MNLVEAITSRLWAITPEFLQIILKIANREMGLEALGALQKERAERVDESYRLQRRGRTAILPVYGPIMKFANVFSMISGATSLQLLMRDFNTAMQTPDIDSIILDIDSPGGEVNGVNEFAQAVYDARGDKKIVAYVGGLGASAAYWIASAAEEIYLDPTAMVGSIGVVASYLDNSERLAKSGVKEIEIVSSSSPKKRPNPATDEGRAQIQERVDALQEIFVAAVARHRGVPTLTVLKDFGQGDMRIGEDAVARGMADGIISLEGLIEKQNQIQFNPQEVFQMKENQQFSAEEITREMIAENFPLLAEQLRREGAEAERIRISEIENLARPGIEKLISKAKFESDDTAAEVALAIIEHEKKRQTALSKAVAADANDVPPLAATPVSDKDAEQRAFDAAVVKGMNARYEARSAAN